MKKHIFFLVHQISHFSQRNSGILCENIITHVIMCTLILKLPQFYQEMQNWQWKANKSVKVLGKRNLVERPLLENMGRLFSIKTCSTI